MLLLAYNILTILLCVPFTFSRSLVVHEKRDEPLPAGLNRQRINRDAVLPMRIGLRQNADAIANAESWLMEVSDPKSAKYGQHWTQKEVIDTFQPSGDTISNVTEWLRGHGIKRFTHSDNKMWFAFDLPAEQAEGMLQTKYYEHQHTDGRFEVSCDEYYLPSHLRSHIDMVTPGIKGSDVTGRSERSRNLKRAAPSKPLFPKKDRAPRKRDDRLYALPENATSLAHCSHTVTPACIRALYNFDAPDPNEPVRSDNAMGLFETGDLYYQGDLEKFYKGYTEIPAGTEPIFAPINGGQAPPNKTNGRGWPLVTGESDLDLMCALPIVYPQNVTVFQTDDHYWAYQALTNLTFGLFNTFLDAVDGSYCTYSAYNLTGNSPGTDPEYPDNRPHGYKGDLQCGVFKPTNVISFSYGGWEQYLPYNYQKRQCDEYLKLGLQGVSLFFSSGDSGVGPFCRDDNRVFSPDQAVGCPWVTAVGATQIGRNKTVNDPEEAVSYDVAGFTSGGGFSLIFDRPSYQNDAVENYFQTSDPPFPYFTDGQYRNSTGRYNRNGRGFPDISANGNNIATYVQNYFYRSGGTSASAPIVAALFNRIVEERLKAGKGPVGFINPTLYQHEDCLNDITIGHNGGCASKGFPVAEGWDPITGLGTPDYPNLLDVFLNLP